MKYLFVFLFALSAQATLPDYTQSIHVSLNYAQCNNPNSFVTIPWIPPNPAYDHVRTHWLTAMKVNMSGLNPGPISGYGYVAFEHVGIQSQIDIGDGGTWLSTTELYDGHAILPLAIGESNSTNKLLRWEYDSTINVTAHHYQTNEIKVRCYVLDQDQEQSYNGPFDWAVTAIGGYLELTWKDLIP